MSKTLAIEYQIALFAHNFNLDNPNDFVGQVIKVFDFTTPSQTINPPNYGVDGLVPRIFISEDDLEIQAGTAKINLIYKQNDEDSGLEFEDFIAFAKKFINMDFFKDCKFSRIGYIPTYVKTVDEYPSFIEELFSKAWSPKSQTFSSRIDYFFDTQKSSEGYLMINMQSVVNSKSEKGILAQFDTSTKESNDIDIGQSEVFDKVIELKESEFLVEKIMLYEK